MADTNPMDLITGLLSNPQAMENIKSMITNMTAAAPAAAPQAPQAPPAAQPAAPVESAPAFTPPPVQSPQAQQTAQVPDLSFLTQMLTGNQQSLQMVGKMKQAYDVYANDNDPSINLLHALSPYLSGKRAQNLNKMVNIVKVGKAASVFRNPGK